MADNYQEEIVQMENAARMCFVHGTHFGSSALTDASWYVVDGDVWYVKGNRAVKETPFDYPSFIEDVKAGKMPWFRYANVHPDVAVSQ